MPNMVADPSVIQEQKVVGEINFSSMVVVYIFLSNTLLLLEDRSCTQDKVAV